MVLFVGESRVFITSARGASIKLDPELFSWIVSPAARQARLNSRRSTVERPPPTGVSTAARNAPTDRGLVQCAPAQPTRKAAWPPRPVRAAPGCRCAYKRREPDLRQCARAPARD